MNTKSFKVIILLLGLFIFGISDSFAQPLPYTCLGIIRVSASSSQRDNQNIVKLVITVPQGALSRTPTVYGPNIVQVTNFLGSTFELHIRFNNLFVDSCILAGGTCVYEMPVDKWVSRWGIPCSSITDGAMRCFYYIELAVVN